MKRAKKLNQSGAVSLLSVVLFSIIITIVATVYVRTVVSQQKNAINYDLGNRAYYAAESGVQDAVRILKNDPSKRVNKSTCSPLNDLGVLGASGTAYSLSYTCQLITVNPRALNGSLGENWSNNATTRILPADSTQPGPFTIRISWSKKKQDGSTDPVTSVARTGAVAEFPPKYRWFALSGSVIDNNRPIHPLLRATLVNRPIASANSSQTQQRVTFLNPTVVAHGGSQVFTTSESLESQQAKLFTNASCYNSDSIPAGFKGGDYSCYQDINLGSGYDFNAQAIYLRLSTFYSGTDFSVKLISGSGASEQEVSLKDSLITIDVTGKAGGNIFRRIQQDVSIGGEFAYDSTPDASIVAGEGICKNYSLGVNPLSFKSNCTP